MVIPVTHVMKIRITIVVLKPDKQPNSSTGNLNLDARNQSCLTSNPYRAVYLRRRVRFERLPVVINNGKRSSYNHSSPAPHKVFSWKPATGVGKETMKPVLHKGWLVLCHFQPGVCLSPQCRQLSSFGVYFKHSNFFSVSCRNILITLSCIFICWK